MVVRVRRWVSRLIKPKVKIERITGFNDDAGRVKLFNEFKQVISGRQGFEEALYETTSPPNSGYPKRKGQVLLIARDGRGNAIGFTNAYLAGKRGISRYLVVHPNHQRRGIGAELFKTQVLLLFKNGISKIEVYHSKGSFAQNILEKSGFKPLGDPNSEYAQWILTRKKAEQLGLLKNSGAFLKKIVERVV